jgi:uncharacterized membrane protein (DUF4010 family)
MLIGLALVAPGHFARLAIPLAIKLGAGIVASILAWFRFRGARKDLPEPGNPSEFRPALLFAAIYALVPWGLAATRQYLAGDDALYAIAVVSGLTDMDAITLSTGQMVEQANNQLGPAVGWRNLVTAAISNLVLKTAIVGIVGDRNLL